MYNYPSISTLSLIWCTWLQMFSPPSSRTVLRTTAAAISELMASPVHSLPRDTSNTCPPARCYTLKADLALPDYWIAYGGVSLELGFWCVNILFFCCFFLCCSACHLHAYVCFLPYVICTSNTVFFFLEKILVGYVV